MNQTIDEIREMVYKPVNGIIDEARCAVCGKLICKHLKSGTNFEVKCKCNEKIRIIVE